MKPKVVFENVSKTYTLYGGRFDKLIDLFTGKRKKNKSFYALNDISFEVFEGETVGIIGVNGSGKSTLSNLLAQVIPPTSGQISIDGETSLIAISAGLNNNLTGFENIELKCLMHGLSKEKIKEITPMIIDFADIGDFIGQPVKNYSSGMKSRLGFAISVHTNPDIMIIDEALSVGDETFYEKCLAKMDEFKKLGKTIFFISHSISQVRSFCDRIIWLHHGKLQSFGSNGKVIREYKDYITWHKSLSVEEQKKYKKEMMANQLLSVNNSSIVNGNPEMLHLRSQKKKKKRNPSTINVQNFILPALFVCMIISAYLLIMDGLKPASNHPIGIESIEKNSNEEHATQQISTQRKASAINKVGFIQENQAGLYKDVEKKNLITSLNFSNKITVLEKVDQLYKIQLEDGTEGYTNQSNIRFLDNKNPNPLIMSDIIPITPDEFSQTYEFYLIYLNAKEAKIKNDLRGLTNEIEQNSNEKLLVYGNDKVQYRIDNGVSTAIIVKDIDINSPVFSQLTEDAILKDKKGNYGLVETDKNQITYNKSDRDLIIQIK